MTYKVTPLNLIEDEVKTFNKNFGKGKLSEMVRQFIHDENERVEKEKKVMGSDKSPLNNYTRSYIYICEKDEKQMTLDIFKMEKRDLSQTISEMEDPQILMMIRDKGRMIRDVAQTKLKRL